MKRERGGWREGGEETETEKGEKKIIVDNPWAQPFCQELLRASCGLTHSIFTATL